MHFDFIDLRLFIAVVEAGSITAGADRACLSLASASARIRGLEQQAGVQLLTRNSRGVHPTTAGECLLHHARQLLQQTARLQGEMSEYAQNACELRIIANTVATAAFLPELLADFLVLHPQMKIVLEEMPSTAIAQAVIEQTTDIGIVADHADTRGLQRYPFRDDKLVVVIPHDHPLSTQTSVTFPQALSYDFIGLTRDSALQQHLSQQALRLDRAIRFRAQVNSVEVICRMVGRGAGIAIVPHEIARHLPANRLHFLALAEPWAVRQLAIVVRQFALLPLPAQQLVTFLRQQA
jgi:DNA-binding transcriptional LysR family regulator